jgi:hypothetical protein
VHTSPSLAHPGALPVVPSVTFECAHPVAGMQESFVHGFESLQLIVVPAQVPAAHLSVVVHALPSSQELPVSG